MNEMKHYEITRDDLSQLANRGADFIKLFPASFGGPDLVKAILAPLPQVQIIPVGGAI